MAVGAPTFCRLPVKGHSVPCLFERDAPSDRMSADPQRAKCTRSAGIRKDVKNEGCRSPVSRILSTPPERGWTVISLTPPRRGAPLARSATNTRESTGGPPFPCSVLHHAGFSMPLRLPSARWALTPPFHPCLCPCGPSAVCFLLHCPSGFLAVPVPHFREARCPVVSGLSSTPACVGIATVRGAAREDCALRG
jgi:hypothetical protein